jgi:hypothetical protein
VLKREIGWRQLDLLATIPIFVSGSALHFAFGWLGEWPPAALFAAVNESVWEHLKIAFWPALFWAAAQLQFGRPREEGYWGARGFGLLAISMVIILVFYGYTAILGQNLLVLDIATFAIAILIGQSVSILALSAVRRRPVLRIVGLTALIAQIGAFSAFTFAPPHLMLFKDQRNGLYGLAASDAISHRRAD